MFPHAHIHVHVYITFLRIHVHTHHIHTCDYTTRVCIHTHANHMHMHAHTQHMMCTCTHSHTHACTHTHMQARKTIQERFASSFFPWSHSLSREQAMEERYASSVDVSQPCLIFRLLLTCVLLVLSPDLIPHIHHFQFPVCDTESDPCWGWFGSGTETSVQLDSLALCASN